MSTNKSAATVPNSGNIPVSSTIAEHYNQLPERGLSERSKSRIVTLRNFNNWIKAVVISDFLQKIKCAKSDTDFVRVLDLCCGKGGDLLKWKNGRIDQLVCADIAKESIEQCKQRYDEMIDRGRAERFPPKEFKTQFIVADCSKQLLKDLYSDPEMKFDLCNCQFSLHYCWETFKQADMMLRNACECLAPGGYFIASTINSYELINKLKASNTLSFGNDFYNVTFTMKENFPLFGCKYNFSLDEVVKNCPEFMVYFPSLQDMAKKYNMELVFCKTFSDIFTEYHTEFNQRSLLGRMKALEAYPPSEDAQLSSNNPRDYHHIRCVHESKFGHETCVDDIPWSARLGTVPLAQWEVISMYIMFVFQKQIT